MEMQLPGCYGGGGGAMEMMLPGCYGGGGAMEMMLPGCYGGGGGMEMLPGCYGGGDGGGMEVQLQGCYGGGDGGGMEISSAAFMSTIASADDLYGGGYQLDTIRPFPADLSTVAGLNDELLMQPFIDIDLEAFAAAAAADEEPKAEPDLDTPAPVVQMDHYPTSSMKTVNHGGATGEVEQQQVGAAAAPCARKRLDHVGYEDLRKYFYMPITTAAREMNVGLTVLKKRCRELGVARWPHRKMKSLRTLIVNIQEMGLPAAAAELERCCAQMEDDPTMELTLQTKKLRQACFKENYKRRRAAAAAAAMDTVYQSFNQEDGNGFFGY